MSNNNPIQTAFEFQRTAVEQTQQATHDAVEAQRTAFQTLAENLDTVQALQSQTNQMSQEAAHAYLDAVEAAVPEDAAPEDAAQFDDLRQMIDDGFESADEVQADAWDSFDDIVDESVAAFDEYADNYTEAVDTTFDTFLDAHEEVENNVEGVADDFDVAAN
ncbi:hypothetical protein [Halostella pelagica]|uniref:hypothetical protein n=1 Tax=Halostella pelagica TaxID=2583824 RepID=UPI00107FE2AF|nr:hypothetical protein [Halostella pelagica]